MIDKKIMVVVALCATVSFGSFFQPSKWDNGQIEAPKDFKVIPGESPIKYQGISQRERELYGYNPRYMPAAVTFDLDNRPYMIFGDFDDYYATNEWTDVYIQTLDDNGEWVVCNLNDLFKSKFPDWKNTKFFSGTHLPEKIAFDQSGGMYLFARAQATSKHYLFYSTDNLKTFSIYEVPGYGIFEHYDTFQDVKEVAALGFKLPNQASISFVARDGNELKIGKALPLSDKKTTFIPQHSGGGNTFLTIDGETHIVYIDMNDITPREFGTKQYYTRYDHKTGEFSDHVYLGFTTSPYLHTDAHNGPAITVDSDGVLHVVLGSHGRAHKYTYSTDKGRTWSPAEDIKSQYGGSYVALITDNDDTMHFISRLNGGELPLIYTLHHLRKEKGTDWVDHGRIILPDRLGYNIFYHNLTIDRTGRLFLSYSYYVAWLSDKEKEEYRQRWSTNPDPDERLYAHDTAMLISEDGKSWRLATTQDFIEGINANK